MFSLKQTVCLIVGIVGALACSVLAGVSFWSIQAFLLKLDVANAMHTPFFYLFVGSFVGVGGSVKLMVKKPSVPASNFDNLPKPEKPDMSSVKKESVVSSGASSVVTVLAGTKLQNGSGTTIELAEDCIMWAKFAEGAPEEAPKKQVVTKKKRFFERVDE